MTIMSSLTVCPINFKKFNGLLQQTNNIESALLLSKINFHLSGSKILKNGKLCIARTREHLASWFNFSKRKTDTLLRSLEEQGFLEKKVGLWYGKKRLFLSSSYKEQSPVNIDLLNTLVDLTGSLKASLIFSKIAFKFANSNIKHDDMTWCCIKKEDLSNWSGFSLRTIDNILNTLARKGFILKKNYVYYGKRKQHYHIPQFAIEVINNTFNAVRNDKEIEEVVHKQNCGSEPAKMQLSIRIRTNTKKTNNNTAAKKDLSKKLNSNESVINFNNIRGQLSFRQQNYLQSAISRTVKRHNLLISSPKDLYAEIEFSLIEPTQHVAAQSFKHKVSRCMKILASGNWRTPFGFHKHSDYGKSKLRDQQLREEGWKATKLLECDSTSNLANELFKDLQKNENRSELTNEAYKFCEQLSNLKLKYGKSTNKAIIEYQVNLVSKIKGLVAKGACKTTIVEQFQYILSS